MISAGFHLEGATPCIKVATNTPMFERMADDMDLNAGTILEGEPVESVGQPSST